MTLKELKDAVLRAEMLHEMAMAAYSATLGAKDRASRVLHETHDQREAARAALDKAEGAKRRTRT